MREKEPVWVESSGACRGQDEEPYCGPSCDSRTPVPAVNASLASNWQGMVICSRERPQGREEQTEPQLGLGGSHVGTCTPAEGEK